MRTSLVSVEDDHPLRFAFVMDQQVGLRTQSLNIERIVREDRSIIPTIVPVCYKAQAGFIPLLPGVPDGVKGTLRGVREIRSGLGAGMFDAALWATWAAKSVPDLVRAAPAFFVLDMTPIQMEQMGSLYGYGRKRARFMRGFKRRATDRIYSYAQHFFPWSRFAADSLQSDYGIAVDRITIISPGVDTQLYQPNPHSKPLDGAVRVLFVGGAFTRKGGDLLLRWLRERRTRGLTNCEIHAVTRDETVASEPGLIVYHGVDNNSAQLIALYQACDVFALPSRADCYSLVALEAMASGLPVIISDIGGISDIVLDSETGFLIQPDDYDALKVSLDRLVEDKILRKRMGEATRAYAEAKFDCRFLIWQMLNKMRAGIVS